MPMNTRDAYENTLFIETVITGVITRFREEDSIPAALRRRGVARWKSAE
jgi:hypothetical protein